MKRKRLYAILASALVLVVGVTIVYLARSERSPELESSAWGFPGSIVVPYGVQHEPYGSSSKNSYVLYDGDGIELASTSGPGSYAATAQPINEGAVVNFRDTVKLLGRWELDDPALSDFMGFSHTSPSGDSAILLYNTSPAANFQSGFKQFVDAGKSNSGSFSGTPEQAALSEDLTLLYVRDETEAEANQGQGESHFKLLAIDRGGAIEEIDFPKGYDTTLPYAPIGTFHYLGRGEFALIEARTVGSDTYETKTYRFKVVSDGGPLKVQETGTSTGSRTVGENQLLARNLRFGATGTIDTQGEVRVYSYKSGNEQITGNLELDATTGMAVGAVSSTSGDFFYLVEGGEITIRPWLEPTRVVAAVPYKDEACANNALETIGGAECEMGIPAFIPRD